MLLDSSIIGIRSFQCHVVDMQQLDPGDISYVAHTNVDGDSFFYLHCPYQDISSLSGQC